MRALILAGISMLWLTAFGCGTYPVAEGSHTSLPPPNSRVVVWGGNASAAEEARAWLLRQQLTVAEAIIREEPGGLTHTPQEAAEVRELARKVGAETAVFVDVSIQSRETWTFGQSGTIQDARVTVRGVSVATGAVMFEAVARHLRPHQHDTGVVLLTCFALARAWEHSLTSCEARHKT
jgi:hypothetical protein